MLGTDVSITICEWCGLPFQWGISVIKDEAGAGRLISAAAQADAGCSVYFSKACARGTGAS